MPSRSPRTERALSLLLFLCFSFFSSSANAQNSLRRSNQRGASSSSSSTSTSRSSSSSLNYNSNANPTLQYEPRSGIITTSQNDFATRPGEGRHRLNSNYNPNGIRTRGVWDAKSKKFYAQETLPGPKKFKDCLLYTSDAADE